VFAGDAVVLRGFNFYSTEAHVRLSAKAPATTVREVEAHICGDLATPITETTGGVVRPIVDCRVRDMLSFQTPPDLPDGIYQVIITEDAAPGTTGNHPTSESIRQFIRVRPPPSTSYSIATEGLDVLKATSGEYGSDEAAITMVVTPIALNSSAPPQVSIEKFPPEGDPAGDQIEDLDDGSHRDIPRVLFSGSAVAGVGLTIIGYEVDDDDAYKQQIHSVTKAFSDIAFTNYKALADTSGAVVGGLVGLGLGQSVAGPIGAAVAFGIELAIAFWAPPDLIIEDEASRTAQDLADLTSLNAPAFIPGGSYVSPHGIDVSVEVTGRSVGQAREQRTYHSSDQESTYRITFRYNRN